MPIFIFGLIVFGCSVIVKPLFDARPAAPIGIIAGDGVRWLVNRLGEDLFWFLRRSGVKIFYLRSPESWLPEQSPERFKGLINLSPDGRGNTQDL